MFGEELNYGGMILTSCTKVRYTKEGRGGVANEEVRVSFYLHSLYTCVKFAFLFLDYLDVPKRSLPF